MAGHDIIVIGTSAGGVEALTRLVKGLPRDLPAAVFVVLHIPEHTSSFLPQILSRSGVLPAIHPTDGQPFENGRIYVAPPGAHLLIEEGHICLFAGPRENRHRPAIDPLFRTAAVAYGPRVVGVVLTGGLNDGTAGLRAIKRRGGVAVVQDPEEALAPSMPTSALAYVAVDRCLALADIPPYLEQVTREPAAPEEDYPVPEDMRMEADIAGLRPDTHLGDTTIGHHSMYTCPECKGPLWEIHDGGLLRFRCRVGHAFTSDALIDGQAEAVNDALWTALETLEQRAQVASLLALRARQNNYDAVTERYEAQVREMTAKVHALRKVLFDGGMRETQANDEIAQGMGTSERQAPTTAGG